MGKTILKFYRGNSDFNYKSLAVLSFLIFFIGAQSVRSEDAPPDDPEAKRVPGLKDVCGDIRQEILEDKEVPKQKIDYCFAAELEDKAAKDQEDLMPVWTGVAAVCTVSCFVPAMNQACGLTYMGAGAYDVMLALESSEDYEHAIKSLVYTAGGAAGAYYFSGEAAKRTLISGTDKGDKKNSTSCVYAVAAGVRAAIKEQEADSFRRERDKNILLAKSYRSPATPTNGNNRGGNQKPSANGGSNSQNAPRGAIIVNSNLGSGDANGSLDANRDGESNAATEGCSPSSGEAAYLACARRLDPKLPPMIETKAFKDLFKKMAGMDMASFAQRVQEGGTPSMSDMAGKLASSQVPEEKRNGLENVFSKVGDIARNGNASSYASSGGGSKRRGGEKLDEGIPDFLSKKTGSAQSNSNRSLAYSNKSYDEIFSNRSLSLFTRVETRYQRASERLKFGKWQTPYNQVNTGQR